MGAFAEAAVPLAKLGLAPIPVGGEDGKTPVVHWRGMRGVKPAGAQRFAQRFGGENVGVLTGKRSEVSIVDVDEPKLLATMLARCGDTPLITRTPSGGYHTWYRFSGERNAQGLDSLKVDVRGEGGLVVVPPSTRPDGAPYAFERGSWSDLSGLPAAKTGSLPLVSDRKIVRGVVLEGRRNDCLFKSLLREAKACDSFNDLLDCAMTLNQNCFPPLTDARVHSTAKSVWSIEQEGRNWVGGHANAVFTDQEITHLGSDPYAFAFLAKLRVSHGTREEPFALDARAMHRDNVMPGWSRNRYLQVTKFLLETGYLTLVHKGGGFAGDASKYLLMCGPRTGPNIIRHPLPL